MSPVLPNKRSLSPPVILSERSESKDLRRVTAQSVVLAVLFFAGPVHAGGPDLSDLFAGYDACLIVRNVVDGTEYRWGGDECLRATVPCSTFKIPHTLIALETGAVRPDERFHWDGSPQPYPAWGRDHDLHGAVRESVVWIFQGIARRIGEERMRAWLHLLGYGNRCIDPAIDRFWLSSGGLKITPADQVEFMARLMTHTLPTSKGNQARTWDRVPTVGGLRGKTGTGLVEGKPALGWFVGMHYDAGTYSDEEQNWQWRAYAYALRIRGPGASGRKAAALAAPALERDGVVPGGARFTFPPEPPPEPTELYVDAFGEDTDLAWLADRTDLRRLEIGNWSGADLSPLRGLVDLEALSVHGGGSARLPDLSWASGLTGLRELEIVNTRTEDLRALTPLVDLRSLSLWSQPVTDLSPLAGMTALEELVLSWTGVEELSLLAGMTQMRALTLPCLARGLEVVRSMPGLEELSVCREDSLDLSFLEGMRHLYKLSLKSRAPIDLALLPTLPMLEELTIMDGPVEHGEALLEIPLLRSLRLVRTTLERDLRRRLEAARPGIRIMEDR